MDQVVERSGLDRERVQSIIKRLHRRGGLTAQLGLVRHYHLAGNVAQFKDESMLWPDPPQAFYELWEEIYYHQALRQGTEMAAFSRELDKISPVRVLPVEETVRPSNRVLDIDSARKIYQKAELITAVPCVCRTQARANGRGMDCPAPERSVCMQTNAYAERIRERELSEVLTREEALSRLGDAEDAGLVHFVVNVVSEDNSYINCNCCSCCCLGIILINNGYPGIFAPSRFRIRMDEENCVGCGECVDRCLFFAISLEEGEETALINLDKCYGCGNCVTACPNDALSLEELRGEDFITGGTNIFE
jgi:ferredoxin